MYTIVFTKMIAWILITSVYFQGTVCYGRYTDLNHGTLLQRTIKPPEKETILYTTLSPPTTSRSRKLSVYDTIRAVAAADKRINGQNWFHQAIVSPVMQNPRPVFPTRETKRYSVQSSPKRISEDRSSQYQQVNARPTSSTRFSNVQATKSYQDQRSTSRAGAISNLDSRNRARARSRISMARRSHSVGDSGLQQEAGMYDAMSSHNSSPAASHFDVYEGGAIALYAVDNGHGHETTSNTHIDRTSDVLEANAPKESRFKVLPNGSIVAYGVSTREYNKNRKITQVQPTKSTFRATDPRTQSLNDYTRKQTRPTAASQRVSSIHYQAPANVKQHQASHGMSTSNQISMSSANQVSPTRSSIHSAHEKPRQKWSPGGGVPVFDDSMSVVLDDQRLRQDDRYNAIPGSVPERGVLDYFPVEATKMTLRQTSTARRTSTRLSPTTTPTKATTTTTKLTTTTTSTTTTTTTPKPKPKDDYWTKQGGVPINISIVNDNHVCPKSRARWQDYTVYLETKPRLCMIQITFNARYKREPIYHNTWWGNNVEWIYRTVYDPEVRMVDLHGWGGSTWYG